ncbi:MAG TPA: ATP-binding protein [Roseiflexaceae bacterium]|nr:ATP-binding protein [Roseiflexaceae bacterium]
MGAEQPVVLREAHTIVAEQLARLRALAEDTRRNGAVLGVALRQAERQLDEALMQQRSAVQWRAPAAKGVAAHVADMRAKYDALNAENRANQHALKQLEQLIRQIEMSSGALTSPDESSNADPWVLALRAQIIQGREEERVRLAREVHDGPAQVLANSLMILESCYTLAQQSGTDKLITMLDRMRAATKDGVHEVRRFIADLRPGALDEHGLAAALGDYIRGYINAYDARVTLDAEPLPRLPRESEIVLYRIVQEALQNAHKYARGAQVAVRLVRQDSKLRLSIRDDGPGFDPHEVARRAGRSNWGLMSMRERAELIGARFSVASSPGHGTEVTVILPLE